MWKFKQIGKKYGTLLKFPTKKQFFYMLEHVLLQF